LEKENAIIRSNKSGNSKREIELEEKNRELRAMME